MILKERLTVILLNSGADIDVSAIDDNIAFEDMGLDSLDMFNFFSQIDEELDIEVPDEIFEQLTTLKKLRTYLESKLSD